MGFHPGEVKKGVMAVLNGEKANNRFATNIVAKRLEKRYSELVELVHSIF